LISSGLNICGEVMLTVIHCLIAKEECSPEDLKQIYAHPEALMQCKRFLSKLNAELISWYDGAAAARIVKRKKHSGLIAGEKVAEIYGLKILLKGIQDSKNNITRFFIISKNPSKPTGDDKTSVVFSTRHKPGALYHALESFAKENINLTRLESMPSKEKPWEYLFLMDFEGHRDDSRVKKALEELKKHVTQVKILGSYPRDKNIFIEGKVR
jgi:chorismate mutase/prephenate dehydratase